jgi:hypothetical protein
MMMTAHAFLFKVAVLIHLLATSIHARLRMMALALAIAMVALIRTRATSILQLPMMTVPANLDVPKT